MADHPGLYSKLVTLPLFIGMSRDELHQIVSVTKFEFRKFSSGEVIAHEGDLCWRLMLLVDGNMEIATPADDHGYTVHEWSSAPMVLQPECAFGLTQRFTRNFLAKSPCNLIYIDKKETLALTDSSLIFRLNLLNLISTALQKRQRDVWHSVPHDLHQRICRFFASHCLYPAGHKVYRIKMVRLAAELNANRLHVSRALNAMQDARLLTLRRGIIDVPSLEELLR